MINSVPLTAVLVADVAKLYHAVVEAAILKLIKNLNSVSRLHAYLCDEHSRQILPRLHLNDVAIGFVKEVAPARRKTTTKMSSDMRSVPGSKTCVAYTVHVQIRYER